MHLGDLVITTTITSISIGLAATVRDLIEHVTDSPPGVRLQGAPWSWKVVEFRKTIFQAWKVMENSKGHEIVMDNDGNVMEFLLLH